MTRSPLRWAGSKRGLLPTIRTVLPPDLGHYIEPFMGSACVYFDSQPDSAILSDFNPHLVEFFTELRDNAQGLIASFLQLDSSGEQYYALRAMDSERMKRDERAARFLYLNRFAFNGVYRTNKAGRFNVPRGVRTGAVPTADELADVALKLQGATIECCNYLTSTRRAVAGDVVYLDPPYRNPTRATYGEYGYESFGTESHVEELAAELARLDREGARVILSFNATEELQQVLRDWHVIEISRRRSVAGSSSSRTELKGEILATNFRVER